MYKNRYNKAEHNGNNIFSSVFHRVWLLAHADEGDNPGGNQPPDVQPPTPAGMNFEEMIARVRKEEKDKLYGQIEKLKGEAAALRESNNGYILQIAEYQKRLETAQANNDVAAKDAEIQQLNDKVTELQGKLDEAEKNKPDEAALRAQIEAEYEVKLYRTEQLAANKDEILSSFVDDVTGKTKEEIDASIAKAVEKSVNIKKELGILDAEGNPVTKPTGRKKSGSDNPSRPPAAAPSNSGGESFDPDYIRNLDPTSPEYKEFRKKMGLK